jgi:hypothetical protein
VYEVSFAMFIGENVLEDGGGRAAVQGGPAARLILPPLLYMLQTCSNQSEPFLALPYYRDQCCGSRSSISSESGYGSGVLITRNLKNTAEHFLYLF